MQTTLDFPNLNTGMHDSEQSFSAKKCSSDEKKCNTKRTFCDELVISSELPDHENECGSRFAREEFSGSLSHRFLGVSVFRLTQLVNKS